MQTFRFDAPPGSDKVVTFTLRPLAATSSDVFYTSTAPADTEIFLFRDGSSIGSFNSLGYSGAAQVGTYLYTLTVPTAAIATAEVVDIVIHGTTFRDAHIQVRTKLKLGQIDINSTGFAGNANAVNLTAHGVGYSLNCADDIYTAETFTIAGLMAVGGDLDIAGKLDVVGNIETDAALAIGTDLTVGDDVTITGDITAASISGVFTSMVLRTSTAQGAGTGNNQIQLDSGASGTNDYYNTAIIMLVGGTGAGQSRVITDYVGASTTATVNRDWATNPSTDSVFVIVPGADVWSFGPSVELAAIPTVGTAGYGDMIQALFQRFFYKRTQSASTFTMFKANSSSSLGTASVDDDGTVQTSGKVTT